MFRAAFTLFALALGGCHGEDELTVINAGSQAVLIELEWEDDDGGEWGRYKRDRVVELPPGAIYNDDFAVSGEMDVIIRRKSDGFILFADDFDGGDFEDDHGHIEITVTP